MKGIEFDARNFSALANSPLGEELWEFIQTPESRVRLITATEMMRPAVEGIVAPLRERFGDAIRDYQARRMIGAMVKQVLEDEGYAVRDQGIRVRTGGVFTTGSRYELKKEESIE